MKGSVLAIDRATGDIRWATRLPGGMFGNATGFVNLLVCPDLLVVHASGRLYGLDSGDGAILWQNPLQGYGYEIATLGDGASGATTDPAAIRQLLEQRRRSGAAGDDPRRALNHRGRPCCLRGVRVARARPRRTVRRPRRAHSSTVRAGDS